MPPSDASFHGVSSWHSNPIFARQDISQITGVHDWNSCMSINYCKWPVIAGIIIVSLVLIGILYCCLRCCGCCVSCLTCCCPSGKHGKYQQAPQYQQPYQQPYQRGPMAYGGGMPAFQFATFDASSKKGKGGDLSEDALPAMPSWQDAKSRQVEDDDSDHESKPLHSPANTPGQAIPMGKLNSPSTSAPPNLGPSTQYEDTGYYGAGAVAAGASDRYFQPHPDEKHQLDDSHLGVHPANHHQYRTLSNDNYDYDLGNPYSQDNLRAGAASPAPSSIYSMHPPPSYHTQAAQGQSDGYNNYNGGEYNTSSYGGGYSTRNQTGAPVQPSGLGRYGSNSTRYAPSTNYASTVGYEPQSTIYEAPVEAEGSYPYHSSPSTNHNPAPAPAALMPAGGRSQHWQRGSVDRKPIKGSWREV